MTMSTSSPLRIQLPDRCPPAAGGVRLPPLDPPPFHAPVIRKCVQHRARVQRLDPRRPESMEEFLILTSMSLPVEDMLRVDPDAAIDDGGRADDGDNGGDDMFYESSDCGSDFSDWSNSSDDEMEGESGDDVDEEDDGGTRLDDDDSDDEDRYGGQSVETSHQVSSMKAFLKGKKPLIKNPHGRYHICVYYAKVLLKSDLHWTETGEEVAIKEVSWEAIRGSRGTMSEDFVKEVAALQHVSEWHRTEMNGSIADTHVLSADFIMSDETNLYIVMPYCAGGDLCQLVANAEMYRLTEDESRHWFRQILKGLESLQLMQICHKDLSPENFMILDGKSLVIDFGMCLRIPYSDAGMHLITPKAACGKKPYIAPEIYLQRPFDGHAVDMWAAGTILHFMLTGRRFNHPLTAEKELHSYDWGISNGAMDLLRKMLRANPDDRLRTVEQIRNHHWVKDEFLCQR